VQVTEEQAQLMQDVYGKGVERLSADNGGMQVFVGPRRAAFVSQSPDHGTGENLSRRGFYRESWGFPLHRALLQRLIFGAATQAILEAERLNESYILMVGRETCDRCIWTQGFSKRRVQTVEKTKLVEWKDPALGFFNSPHKDQCDRVSTDQELFFLNQVGENSFAREKAKNIMDTIHIGLPTTCGYNLIGSTNGYNPLVMFGVMGFAVPIQHQSVHHFFGWSFMHYTAVPMLVQKNKVRVSNLESKHPQEPTFFVGAWGCFGGSKEARARMAAKKAEEAKKAEQVNQRETRSQTRSRTRRRTRTRKRSKRATGENNNE
jgi:hypothetical protein